MARLHIFAPFNPELLGVLSSKISVKKKNKKKHYLKLRFMCQDMPRMQDFAPFTTELLKSLRIPNKLTCGPPIMNFPDGCIWNTVLLSRYFSGITVLTTFSINSFLRVSMVTTSSCCKEMTTVWTLKGTHAPFTYW